MANNTNVSFEGFDGLEEALKDLEFAVQKKVMRKAVRDGMQPVLTQIKQQVSSRWGEKSGVLEASVIMKTSAPKKNGWADMIANVGVFRVIAWENVAQLYYKDGYVGSPTLAYWYEHGTKPHSLFKGARTAQATQGKGIRKKRNTGRLAKYQDQGVTHPGLTAKPVLRPVMDANVEIVTTRTGNILGAEIEKQWKKAAKGAKK